MVSIIRLLDVHFSYEDMLHYLRFVLLDLRLEFTFKLSQKHKHPSVAQMLLQDNKENLFFSDVLKRLLTSCTGDVSVDAGRITQHDGCGHKMECFLEALSNIS